MHGFVTPVFFLFLIIIAAGMAGGFMAADRGRSVAAWCCFCALLPPLLFFLYFARPLCEVEGMFKRCSTCGELIKWRSTVCKFCKAAQLERG